MISSQTTFITININHHPYNTILHFQYLLILGCKAFDVYYN